MRDQMHVRHVIGLVLAVLTLPLLVLGIFDPIEGGVAMLLAGILLLATWLVSRIPVPRLEWIAWPVPTRSASSSPRREVSGTSSGMRGPLAAATGRFRRDGGHPHAPTHDRRRCGAN